MLYNTAHIASLDVYLPKKKVFGVAPFELHPPPDPTRMLYVMSHLTLRETLSLGKNGRRGAGGWGRNGGGRDVMTIPAMALGGP